MTVHYEVGLGPISDCRYVVLSTCEIAAKPPGAPNDILLQEIYTAN